jgi:hypothetical protein
MKIKNWKQIRPFEYFMSEMEDKIKKMRDELLKMHKLGHLRCKYIIEKNEEMARLMEDMVKCDNKIQVLVGDELKQDQFEFFYNSVKIIFDTALQDYLYNMKTDKTKMMEEVVIPEIIAYQSVMRIRNI